MKKLYFLSLLIFAGSISFAQCDLSTSFTYEIEDGTINFTNTSTGVPADPEFLWIIAEVEYDIENPSVDFDDAYLHPGVYFEITGLVDGERCYDSTWLYIEELVDSCDINTNFTWIFEDGRYYFTNTSTGEDGESVYSWSVDGIDWSDDENPSLGEGDILDGSEVCLEITDDVSGCHDVYCFSFVIEEDSCVIDANFTWVLDGDTYYFTNTSIGEGDVPTYQWLLDWEEWSDDENSTLSADDLVGGGIVCLVVSNELEDCEQTFCYTFEAAPCELLTSFSYEVIGDSFYFTNTSTGEGAGSVYSWTYDGVEFSADENSSMLTDGVPDSSFVCFEIYDSITDCRSMSCIDIHSDEFDDCGMIVDFTMDVEADRIYFVAEVTDGPSGAEYEWFDDGVLIAEVASPDFAIGDIEVDSEICLRVTDGFGMCSETDCDIFLGAGDLNIENVELNNFTLYPNPANNQINIQFAENTLTQGQVQVYNSIGELIIQQTINSGNAIETIAVSDLSEGFYIVKITDMNSGYSNQKRFVKQ
ncbi:T9SS type A sorting domain-containing protein [Crocinitomix catalasitica]|uniref:T9SS type A sorting domain-containing protein n=1 Tax=Crocinitomix catalasitica TaxID=184607 RepID=UPI0004896C26|nr:T9SS type A sorting domain-containing protein [Crocinitomix catalasitica]